MRSAAQDFNMPSALTVADMMDTIRARTQSKLTNA
jgi:hypothetical protein